MMPGEDGMALVRSLRETIDVPILMLTARAESESRIAGLEVGRRRLSRQAVRAARAAAAHQQHPAGAAARVRRSR